MRAFMLSLLHIIFYKFAMDHLYDKALNNQTLTQQEALLLYEKAPLPELMQVAALVRQRINPGKRVGWIIDRNVNITNICFCQCRFCNFCRTAKHPDAYVTSIEDYALKINELFSLGGAQLLLQGGMHPEFDIVFYENLFRRLKELEPRLRLHALGPPEVVHIARISGLDVPTTLKRLVAAGLDSLPGAGAEILDDRVRKIVSPAKCTSGQWLEVMREAHRMRLPTSATMMFGHVETFSERIIHMLKIRDLQDERPSGSQGFGLFVSWPFQSRGTRLGHDMGQKLSRVSVEEYIRTVALSRIVIQNINHIQASWLTIGPQAAQLCLQAGADDMGSIMIEENVVSAAGASFGLDANAMQQCIRDAGFEPVLRNQKFEYQ